MNRTWKSFYLNFAIYCIIHSVFAINSIQNLNLHRTLTQLRMARLENCKIEIGKLCLFVYNILSQTTTLFSQFIFSCERMQFLQIPRCKWLLFNFPNGNIFFVWSVKQRWSNKLFVNFKRFKKSLQIRWIIKFHSRFIHECKILQITILLLKWVLHAS